ncbi:MAG: response regulator [Deltaproteobacteria bacterium]|nr:response regulator [Deltaproteobacteria bacterium]
MHERKILIIEDETDLVELLSYNLKKEGFSTISCTDGWKALNIVRKEKPDLILLDLMLPGLSGIEICKMIREDKKIKDIPIIMVTAKTTETDKVVGLEIGADDYVTKPFSIRELIARIKAVLRRSKNKIEKGDDKEELLIKDGLEIALSSCEVKLNNKDISLTPTEFKILAFLAKNRGRVFTRDQLLDSVWGKDTYVEPKTVDVHIRRLRAKIGSKFIITVRGIGYKFPA